MKKKIEAICIVAHPDDETIWMGGIILKNPDWEWTILCLSRKNDKDRAPKFRKVCELYGVKGIISDLDDEKLEPLNVEKVAKKIKDNLPKKKFEYIFTHGKNGEYGHLRHKEIHEAVLHLIFKNELIGEKVYFFSYLPGSVEWKDSGLKIPISNPNPDWRVFLDDETLQRKIEIVVSTYDFGSESFEALSCASREAFDLKKEEK
ncbi:MAG: PIG-L family deacetylase [Nanoarchaeota archaeon]|nr:PIG-L family deacetylase [Nanoarchaeota archaeon]MBU1051722.1 PIG-L family deacetylase [Nanoarchaeota archaeon]MBU1988658.1 PIG-L family deacetylase [Nanoarchaeota archaeon]